MSTTITLLPSNNCDRCGRFYMMHFNGEYDPEWFSDVIYYKEKPTKPYKTIMKQINLNLCSGCYLKMIGKA